MKDNNEILFTRNLLCAVIEQSVLDAQNETEYMSKSLQQHREANQRSAIAFFNSKFYADLCSALSDASGVTLPHKKIRQKAFA